MKLTKFLRQNQPQPPEPRPGEKERIWTEIQRRGRRHQPDRLRLPWYHWSVPAMAVAAVLIVLLLIPVTLNKLLPSDPGKSQELTLHEFLTETLTETADTSIEGDYLALAGLSDELLLENFQLNEFLQNTVGIIYTNGNTDSAITTVGEDWLSLADAI